MMKLLKLLQYNKEITLNQVKEIEFFGPEIQSFRQVIDAIYDEEGNSLDAARHPLQIVQIKVNHPIYPKNMMRKEIR